MATFNFDHLDISKAQKRLDIPEVSPDAYLIVRPANDENRRYREAQLAMSGQRKRYVTSENVTREIELDREDDRTLYPKYVVVDWGGIRDADTNELVPFSRDECTAFFRALPNWPLDRIRLFCMRPENFVKQDEILPDPAELAGN